MPDQEGATFRTALLINDAWVEGEGETIRVVNPATEEPIVTFRGASVPQVDQAVEGARAAFFSGLWDDPAVRRHALLRLAEEIEGAQDELMETLVQEIGAPVGQKANQIFNAPLFLRWYADAATVDHTRNLGYNEAQNGIGSVAYRPVGVVAAISAFNYPIFLAIAKIGAALAAGCTTVLLSSPQAPLAINRLGDLIRRAGFPAGVVNIISGGIEAGRALTEHDGVDKVSFTGSVDVGRKVMQQAAAGLKSTVLELGGKSAAIMLPGVDYGKYMDWLHARYIRHSGQGCGSPTRILIEESRYDEFAELSRAAYTKIRTGDPRDPANIGGPVISAAQKGRIEAKVVQAVADGAEIIAGGGPHTQTRGWYVNPVLLGRLNNQAPIAREEVFGPVAVVITYRTVEEALAIANDSDLALKAYLFGQPSECLRLAPRLRVGTVQINGGTAMRPDAPVAGYKLSGAGAECGVDGLREFLQPQFIDCPIP